MKGMKTFRNHLNEKLKNKKFAVLYKTEHGILGLALRLLMKKIKTKRN